MAYSVAWSESDPVGSAVNANTLDTEIQNLKISIRERMDDLLDPTGDWGTDAEQPKVLNLATALGGPDIGELIGTPQIVEVFKTASPFCPTGVDTLVTWEDEFHDTGDFHDNGTNNERLTITDAGYYRVYAGLQISAGASNGTFLSRFLVNGTNDQFQIIQLVSGLDEWVYFSKVFLFAAADFIEVECRQDLGVNVAVVGGTVNSVFGLEKLSGTT